MPQCLAVIARHYPDDCSVLASCSLSVPSQHQDTMAWLAWVRQVWALVPEAILFFPKLPAS